MQRRRIINRKFSGMLVVAAVGLLTGCVSLPTGDDSDEAAPEPEASPSEKSTRSAPPAAGNAQVTPPGTKLKVGQKAVVPWEYGSSQGTIGITVTAIEKGDEAVFRQQFGAKATGLVPYYIRYTVENIGGTDLANAGGPRLSAQLADGNSTGVVLIGSLPDCESGDDDDFNTAGATFETCRLQAARTGTTITSAVFEDELGGYDDREIVWST